MQENNSNLKSTWNGILRVFNFHILMYFLQTQNTQAGQNMGAIWLRSDLTTIGSSVEHLCG